MTPTNSKREISDATQIALQSSTARRIPWNKGIKTGQKVWNKGLKGVQVAWNKGKKVILSKEALSKMRAAHLGKPSWNSGKKGLQVAWNKGIIDENTMPRLKNKARERDGYTCQICGLQEKGIMTVDHIIPKRIRPDLKFDITNLMVLCPNCHARKTLRDIKSINLFKKGQL
jgi:5-methylcytosine-specific restriction endonuclease McrA